MEKSPTNQQALKELSYLNLREKCIGTHWAQSCPTAAKWKPVLSWESNMMLEEKQQIELEM